MLVIAVFIATRRRSAVRRGEGARHSR
jgi:hypothetical protein